MSWHPLTRENTVQTQELIEETLGLSRTTFRASAFLRQGDGAAFTEAQPRDRKAILAEILDLDLWDRMLDRARGELRDVERELVAASTNQERLESAVADQAAAIFNRDHARSQRDGAAELVVDAEQRLEEAQEQHAAVAAKNERLLRLHAALTAAVQERDRLKEQLTVALAAESAVADCRVELEEAEADAAAIPALETKVTALRAAAAKAEEARRRRGELADQLERREIARQRLVDQALELHAGANECRAKAQHLDDHIGEASACDRCGQTLGVEAAARAAKSYRDDAADLDQRAAEIDTETATDLEQIAALHEQLDAIEIPAVDDPAPIELQLRERRAAAAKQLQLQERIRHLDHLAAQRPDLMLQVAQSDAAVVVNQNEVDAARVDAGDISAAERAVAIAKGTVRDTRAALEQRAADLARAEQRLEQIAAAQAELDQLNAATTDLQQRVDVLKLAERAYGRDGIPALIVENAAIPQIEVEANRILEMMPTSKGETFRVELHTQRALKTSESLKDTLDIVVYGDKGARPYETFSGGEHTRLNIALRLALAHLLAHRRGAESKLLAIDEVEYLDDSGHEDLLEVIRSVAGTFDRILMVSHHPNLRHAFDATIECEVDSDGHSIIRSGAAQEVLA